MVGQDDLELLSPETAGHIDATDREVIARGVTVTLEEVVSTTDVTRTYLTTKGPYRDDRGRDRSV